jgi:hypothetical protein
MFRYEVAIVDSFIMPFRTQTWGCVDAFLRFWGQILREIARFLLDLTVQASADIFHRSSFGKHLIDTIIDPSLEAGISVAQNAHYASVKQYA